MHQGIVILNGYLGQYDTVSETILSRYSYHTRVQVQIFRVHFSLLQIVLCMQLPRSADWKESKGGREY